MEERRARSRRGALRFGFLVIGLVALLVVTGLDHCNSSIDTAEKPNTTRNKK